MDLKERTRQISERTRWLKEEWVSTGPENPDLSTQIFFYRGDELVVLVQAPVDRDNTLRVARAGSMGFSATTMAVTFESFHSTVPENPATRRPWRPGEMQFVYETDPEASAKGLVHSCITLSSHERGGAWMVHTMPYQMDDNIVKWLEDEDILMSSEEEKVSTGGLVFDALQDFMTQPLITDAVKDPSFEFHEEADAIQEVLPEELTLFHADMATYNALKEAKVVEKVFLYAPAGSVRAAMIQMRLGNET